MKHTLKKPLRLLFPAVVFAMLLTPLVTMCIARNNDAVSIDNRGKTPFPSLKNADGGFNAEFFSGVEAWFSDSFGLRSEMITANNAITRSLLATSMTADVIQGKDGWLYYTPTISDATGHAAVSASGAKHIAHTIRMMQNYAASVGANFVFTSAPNKASIYPQYLPARYFSVGGENTLDLVTQALATEGAAYCDLRAVLRENADNAQLYHKTDTHWNGAGAMIGFTALRTALGKDTCGFPDAAQTVTCDFEGDLLKMCSPARITPDENIVFAIPQTFSYLGRHRTEDDLQIQTQCADGNGSLLLFRDSFGRALIPLFSQSYAQCTYLRGDRFALDQITATGAEDVVCELVERNIPNLLEYAPQCPAMPTVLSDLTTANLSYAADAVTHEQVVPQVYATADGAYEHIYGTFHNVAANCDAVYCEIGGVLYEAFPCYEKTLLHENQTQDNGFSLYLPSAAWTEGNTVHVLAKQNGSYIDLGTATPLT